jgi:two-component system, OmpR family, copper resistance phosphate regulon response regulator CusR
MRILVIGEEGKMANYLRNGLPEHGFVIDLAQNGEDGLSQPTTGDYALIVLDLMFPDRDG